MATDRMPKCTVILRNYVGEIDDVATYQTTTLRNCYCIVEEGVALGNQGRHPADMGTLYIFDKDVIAIAEDGSSRSYVPFDVWKNLDDKSAFWTISDKGTDEFQKQGTSRILKITSFVHRVAGTKRMWHFEVKGK